MTEAALRLTPEAHAARQQMIQQQLRTWEVLDDDVLNVFAQLDRERFVPDAYRSLAYADLAIPLGEGEHMLQPKLAGRIVQAVKPNRQQRVLEIGTGSGYLTAAFGKLACSVRSLEHRALQADHARRAIKESDLRNIDIVTADAYAEGALGELLYDVVVLGGSLPVRDSRFESKVAIGGKLFAVIGDGPVMAATLLERTSADDWRESILFETVLKTLHGASRPSEFRF